MKFSGYITAQFEGGNLSTQYNWASYGAVANAIALTNPALAARLLVLDAASGGAATQRVLLAGSDVQGNSTWYRDATGWTTRANFGFDIASNTAYGPLIGHFDINANYGSGFDTTAVGINLNTGYLTWAGITAGGRAVLLLVRRRRRQLGELLLPDRKGYNQPNLLAYTASFGGGFSATLSAENPHPGAGTVYAPRRRSRRRSLARHRRRTALQVGLGRGSGLSGVVHDVLASYNSYDGAAGVLPAYGGTGGCGIAAVWTFNCNNRQTKTGWALDAGVKVNLPSFGAGDNFLVTAAYSQNAIWYSGIPGAMRGEGGQVNGNGQPMFLYDTAWNPLTNQWSTPTAWSVSALLEHHFTPAFYIDLEGSYGHVHWSNAGGGCNFLLRRLRRRAGDPGRDLAEREHVARRTDIGWMPVTNLNFDLELMYQSTVQDRPSGALGRSTTSAASAARSSLPTGKATRAASLAASASPVTSDRNPIE